MVEGIATYPVYVRFFLSPLPTLGGGCVEREGGLALVSELLSLNAICVDGRRESRLAHSDAPTALSELRYSFRWSMGGQASKAKEARVVLFLLACPPLAACRCGLGFCITAQSLREGTAKIMLGAC